MKLATLLVTLFLASCGLKNGLPPLAEVSQIESGTIFHGKLTTIEGCIRLDTFGSNYVLALPKGVTFQSSVNGAYLQDVSENSAYFGRDVSLVAGQNDLSNFANQPKLYSYLEKCGGPVLSVSSIKGTSK